MRVMKPKKALTHTAPKSPTTMPHANSCHCQSYEGMSRNTMSCANARAASVATPLANSHHRRRQIGSTEPVEAEVVTTELHRRGQRL